MAAQNGQSIETGNAVHTRQRIKTPKKNKKKRTQCALDTTLRKQTQITFINFPLRRIEFIFHTLRWNCLLSINVLSKRKLKRHPILFSKHFLKKPPQVLCH